MIRSLLNTADLCCESFVDFYDLQDLSLRMTLYYHCDNAYSIRSTGLCYRLIPFLTVAYNGKHCTMDLSLIDLVLIFPI